MSLKSFMQGVKDGTIRGDYTQQTFEENIIVELSVSTFEYGHIHIRILVNEPGLDTTTETYFNHLYPIDTNYKTVHTELIELFESENETPVRNDYMWTSQPREKVEEYPWIPDTFTPTETHIFDGYAQLRDDVTVAEAIETNRTE